MRTWYGRLLLAVVVASGCGGAGPPAGGKTGVAGSSAAGANGAAGSTAAAGTDGAAGVAPSTAVGGATGATPDGAAGASPIASDAGDATAPSADADAARAVDSLPHEGPVNVINSQNWNETLHPFSARRMLVRDAGNPHVLLLDFGKAEPVVWSTASSGAFARGLQLIGNNQVLGSRTDGYDVLELTTGEVVKKVTGFGNTQSAYRMASGETMLARSGTSLAFLDKNDQIAHTIAYPGYGFVRTPRPTRNGTFLVPSDMRLFEGDATGKVLWFATGTEWGHIYEPLLMSDGNVLVSTFQGSSLDVVDGTTHTVTKRFGTKAMPNAAMFVPMDFAGIQILPNGNLVTANWQGYGAGNGMLGVQIIEFTPAGDVAWFYKQDAAAISSLQDVLVIDGLDPAYLHVQETSTDSTWQPVIPTP